MLEKVEFIFPKKDENIKLFNLIFSLLKDKSSVKKNSKEEIFMQSSDLKPAIIFKLEDVNEIQWNIENQEYLNFLNRKESQIENQCEIKKLSADTVLAKLSGHVIRVDHIGINLPTNLYDKKEWDNLLKYFSSISNIYSYPTGEPWPFLLPATEKENEMEITNFEMIREPRLEFVYDDYTNVVTIHIDIETDLLKSEVEVLFPKDEGIYFNNLEEIYRAIYLDYNQYMDIRLDVRYKCIHDDFESGEWFVSEGKRITAK